MIHRLAEAAAEAEPGRAFLVSDAGQVSYAEAAAVAQRTAAAMRARSVRRAAIYMPNSPELVLALLGAARAGVPVCVLNHEFSRAEVEEIVARLQVSHLVVDTPLGIPGVEEVRWSELTDTHGAEGPADDAEVLILTTGTTGAPKAARYLWSRLASQARVSEDQGSTRWLLAYNLNHFGGMQMLLHVLSNRATLVLPASLRPVDAVAAMERHEVTHVSATPTFWRMAKVQVPIERLQAIPVRHVTLGAEAASGDLLDELRRWFPRARIVHIFAATEVGSCFSVDDGRDGAPASILERGEESAVQFRIEDGELFIRSRNGMIGYFGEEVTVNDGWRSTGDLVEQSGDRIHFVGRKSERINVGGVKVDPLPVEQRVQRVPRVVLARVYGKANAITGNLVAVDVVLEPDADRAAAEREIRRACNDLPPQARPRLVRFVEELETRNLKLSRRAS